MLRVSPVLGSLSKRIRALNTPADIYIINRENVVWLVDYYRNAWPFDMVVVDESSSFKSHKAKRFKALASMSTHIDRLIELTGTPSPNGLNDLWAQVFLLDGGERLGTKYTQFRERYFDPGDRGNNVIYNYKVKPGSENSILERISDICISMKSEDYLQLPDVTYNQIPVILDPKSSKAYYDLEAKMVLALPEAEEEISVTSAAALSNKLLQLANGALYDEDHNVYEIHNCKIEAFMELIESLQGKPALVFYNYQHDKERILKALKDSGLRVRELKTTQDEDDWNNREIDILLTHPASSAYGLNLQQGGNHVIWFGLNWNYELYTQANKRLHRQGQTEKVIIHHLVCSGTRDEDVMQALERKDGVQNWVMESLKARIRRIKGDN
nr:MAG TPA: Chromatin remodeling complex ATPase [Caudoviricetes sp.]